MRGVESRLWLYREKPTYTRGFDRVNSKRTLRLPLTFFVPSDVRSLRIALSTPRATLFLRTPFLSFSLLIYPVARTRVHFNHKSAER